ncbi:hypothetical protein PsYK624_139200 [Phanerochaete sordida]|uniref:F-box domain-containing protein n=1 Tax=Phanerochaete sordida TaxID=48140 RepID=A0A9P3GQP3_9APHY|nr:hypothetical protein PsYK624_139200 [Phanerochaete sordida]
MEARIPEELLREILLHNILPLHSDFLRFHEVYAGHYQLPPISRCGHLLLVCKRWNRIGTPLLYECLRISTHQRAAAVAKVLHANPELGQAVRCLKVEGGFGKGLAPIGKALPRVHSVHIVLRMKSGESILGLEQALKLFLGLTTLHIELESQHNNKTVTEARTLIYECIKDYWLSLRNVGISDAYYDAAALADALAQSSIEEFECRAADLRDWSKKGIVQKILSCPSLQRIVCRGNKRVEKTRQILKDGGVADTDIEKFRFIHHTRDDEFLLEMLMFYDAHD